VRPPIAKGLRAEEDVDEIAKRSVRTSQAAGFIEPTSWPRGAEAGTDPSWGGPKRAGKDRCGDFGTGTRATGWITGQKGYKRA